MTIFEIKAKQPKVSVSIRLSPATVKQAQVAASNANVKPTDVYRSIIEKFFDEMSTKSIRNRIENVCIEGGDE